MQRFLCCLLLSTFIAVPPASANNFWQDLGELLRGSGSRSGPGQSSRGGNKGVSFTTVDTPQQLEFPRPGLGPDDKDLVQSTCDPRTTGISISSVSNRIGGYNCRPALLTKKLADFMDDHLASCVQDALDKSGKRVDVNHIEIQSMGTISSRVINANSPCRGQALSNAPRGCAASYHATGRAIDIAGLIITGGRGERFHLPLSCTNEQGRVRSPFFGPGCRRNPNTVEGRFYDQFNMCWENRIKAYNNGTQLACGDGIIGCDDNQKHHNHIHLSLPLCPNVPGIARS